MVDNGLTGPRPANTVNLSRTPVAMTPGSMNSHNDKVAVPPVSCANWYPRLSVALRIFFWILLPLHVSLLFVAKETPWFLKTVLCSIVSLGCYMLTCHLIPPFAALLKHKNLSGKDLNKPQTVDLIPESLGLVTGAVFLIFTISCQLFFSKSPEKLLEYNSGLLAICCMTFLGFVDDVLDLRWRYKMILPLFAGLPLVVAYRGRTTILLPRFVQNLFNLPSLIDLGLMYHVYMMLLAIFCTNSINIYAGINGLEVGQALVMCIAVIAHNFLSLHTMVMSSGVSSVITTLGTTYPTQHLFSLLLSFPFLGCSSALLVYNWYPSTVFVGDTFTYFAGMYFAVVGILGNFSKTLLLFFIPQIINFLLSVPQLVGWIPCPRHRVPKLCTTTGLLEPSSNWTLINVVLQVCGPMSEKRLCVTLVLFQAVCCLLGLFVRHRVFGLPPP